MAITRRQFVTTLGALAAAMGVAQTDLSKVTEAFGHGGAGLWSGGGWTNKPKVIWLHGAECTGCSTSLLSFFEDVRGKAIQGKTLNTLNALDFAVGGTGNGAAVLHGEATSTDAATGLAANGYVVGALGGAEAGHPFGHRTIHNTRAITGIDFDGDANGKTPYSANVADVLIDFIDLQYHETVMGMGGDLAAQWLEDACLGVNEPFVLVTEGALQDDTQASPVWGGATTGASWCSIGKSDDGTSIEHSFGATVQRLAVQDSCKAVVAFGQCATFGGYPACVSPVLKGKQTPAQGTYDFLSSHGAAAAAGKVINVPGCPSNPWWFVLTVVAWLVDVVNPSRPLGILTAGGAINPDAVDATRRLKAVFGTPIHGPACPRYQDFLNGDFATTPGAAGCLQLVGCKGPSTKALCNVHGWNSAQPQNDPSWDNGIAGVYGTKRGTSCIAAGAPCMGCAEKGYPDAFVPFVVR